MLYEVITKTVDLVHGELEFIYAALDKLEIRYIRSQANFLMIEIGEEQSADEVYDVITSYSIHYTKLYES